MKVELALKTIGKSFWRNYKTYRLTKQPNSHLKTFEIKVKGSNSLTLGNLIFNIK